MIRNVIIKVTLDCNIQCKYCYVQRNRDYECTTRIMEKSTLEMLIKRISEYLKQTSNIDRFVFYWHGGEPLLAGTSFFEECFRLQQNDIPLSVLSVITPDALPHGHKIYQHLREIGVTWMDFMYPFYSNIDNTLDQSIKPLQWGQFYKDVFGAWIEEGNPNIYIRMLHDLCMRILGAKTSMCCFSSDCSYVITVDPSGNIYICDDLLSYADSLLGNIFFDSLFDINTHQKLTRLSKISTLYGEICLNCDCFSVCKGGCTLFRAKIPDDFHRNDYFCEAQRCIINHLKNYFQPYLSNNVRSNSERGSNLYR